MVGRAVRWWREWLSVTPGTGDCAAAPGWFESRYRRAAAAIARHATIADTALAALVGLCAVPQLLHWALHAPGQFGGIAFYSVLMVVPLIWRRRFPLSVFAFAVMVALAQWSADIELAADIALLVYLYTVANRYPLRVGVLAAAVLEAGAMMAAVRWPQARTWAETFLFLSSPVLAALLFGVNVRHRRSALSALTERAEQLERERDQQGRIAAAAERTRIAREMHDVVAHSLSVMVTLSEGAALKQAAEPERAASAMRQVSATGHQALDEMRRLLGVLRTEDAPDNRQPQPGLDQLDGLIEQVRATGLAAESTVTGAAAAMPPGAELTVFRIVQEALTNTLKHAVAPTRVSVAIAYRPDSVTVDIHDDGARGVGHPEGRSMRTAGHGLTGMRERAAVYGGEVSAGPASTGGWHVHARLPLAMGVLTTATASSDEAAIGRVR